MTVRSGGLMDPNDGPMGHSTYQGRRFVGSPRALKCPGTGCAQRGTREWLGEHCRRVHGKSYRKLARLRRRIEAKK